MWRGPIRMRQKMGAGKDGNYEEKKALELGKMTRSAAARTAWNKGRTDSVMTGKESGENT